MVFRGPPVPGLEPGGQGGPLGRVAQKRRILPILPTLAIRASSAFLLPAARFQADWLVRRGIGMAPPPGRPTGSELSAPASLSSRTLGPCRPATPGAAPDAALDLRGGGCAPAALRRRSRPSPLDVSHARLTDLGPWHAAAPPGPPAATWPASSPRARPDLAGSTAAPAHSATSTRDHLSFAPMTRTGSIERHRSAFCWPPGRYRQTGPTQVGQRRARPAGASVEHRAGLVWGRSRLRRDAGAAGGIAAEVPDGSLGASDLNANLFASLIDERSTLHIRSTSRHAPLSEGCHGEGED